MQLTCEIRYSKCQCEMKYSKCQWLKFQNNIFKITIISLRRQGLMSWANSLWPRRHHKVIYIWVNTGSGNGLLADCTKPWPESMLTYHQSDLVTFTWGQFPKRYLRLQSLKLAWKLLKISFKSPRGQWVNQCLVYNDILPQQLSRLFHSLLAQR